MKTFIFFSFLLIGLFGFSQKSNQFSFNLSNCATDSMWVIYQDIPENGIKRGSFKIKSSDPYIVDVSIAGTVIQFMDENFTQRKIFIFHPCEATNGKYGFGADMNLKDSFLVFWEGDECKFNIYSEEETAKIMGE